MAEWTIGAATAEVHGLHLRVNGESGEIDARMAFSTASSARYWSPNEAREAAAALIEAAERAELILNPPALVDGHGRITVEPTVTGSVVADVDGDLFLKSAGGQWHYNWRRDGELKGWHANAWRWDEIQEPRHVTPEEMTAARAVPVPE